MTAQERLAAALREAGVNPTGFVSYGGMALGLSAADPTLAQDIEDGRALRELREALLSKYRADRVSVRCGVQSDGTAWCDWWVEGFDLGADLDGPTIAAAADACREALR